MPVFECSRSRHFPVFFGVFNGKFEPTPEPSGIFTVFLTWHWYLRAVLIPVTQTASHISGVDASSRVFLQPAFSCVLCVFNGKFEPTPAPDGNFTVFLVCHWYLRAVLVPVTQTASHISGVDGSSRVFLHPTISCVLWCFQWEI